MAVTSAGDWSGRESFGSTVARLLRLSWPIVLARVGVQTMGLVDAVAVGHYSVKELGYQVMGWVPTSVVLTTAIGLLTGVQVLAARRVGEGRPELAGAVLRRGLVYAACLGVGSTTLLVVFGPWLLRALGIDADLARGAGPALRIFSLSLTPYLLSCVLSFWLEGLARPKPGLVAMGVANGVNILLNIVFVPGLFGLPAGGAVGGGWATLGARVVLMVGLAVYVWRMKDATHYGVFVRPPRDPAQARMQRRIGYGAGASYFVEAGAFVGINVVAAWLGALQVAAWAIVLNFCALIFMVPLGVAGATAVLVGQAYGAGDRRGVLRASLIGFGVAVAVELIFTFLALFGAGAVVRAYAVDPALVALASATLVAMAAFMVPDGVQVVVAQALRARGDVLLPTVTHIASYALVMAPLSWALAHPAGLGLYGCVVAVVVASCMSAGLLLLRFWQLTLRDRRGSRPVGRPTL